MNREQLRHNADYRRRHAKATSDAMKRRAAQAACPACKRKGALRKFSLGTGFGSGYACRYCGHEHIAGAAR